jgi:ATP-dependent DNA ligase
MSMPDWLEPMAATLTQARFAGDDWIFERKFDGIRLIAYKHGSDVRLFSRNRLAKTLPAVAAAISSLPVDEVILDGEVTWDGQSGYHVFDILWLNGRAVTAMPIEDRRALLQSLPFEGPMRRVELVEDHEPWERARREGWEGVIAKRRGSPYEHRRSKHWLKMKIEASQELVVGGFTDPQGARVGLGALLVGYTTTGLRLRREDRHRLRYEASPRSANALDAIALAESPFTKAKGPPRRGHWVRPEIVVQVGFIEWTSARQLAASAAALPRSDKDSRSVVRE